MKPNPEYRAYLLRLWLARDNGSCWRASLENAHTHELHVFAEMAGVFSYLEALTGHDIAGGGDAGLVPLSTAQETRQPEGSSPMWMSMTTLKTDLANVARVEAILRECGKTLPEDLRGREGYQIHSAGEPGTIISITIWDSPEQQKRLMGSEHNVRLIREELMPLLLTPPERAAFQILAHTVCRACDEF